MKRADRCFLAVVFVVALVLICGLLRVTLHAGSELATQLDGERP